MTALSDLLNDSAVAPARAIERIEESAEHSMNKATVYRYLEGRHPASPSERYLLALAHGFDLKITEVRKAAKVRPGELGPWVPPTEAGRLSKPVRDALNTLILTITKEGAPDGPQATPQKIDPQSGLPSTEGQPQELGDVEELKPLTEEGTSS